MGKKWDYSVPSVEEWVEILRVLKPGAFGLVACGTRTQHRMAVNLEDAGFEIRDVIAWIYGSGFPKSTDIAKSIDKHLGVEREVVGTAKGMGRQNPDWNGKNKGRSENYYFPEYEKTIATSDLAKQWDGWGTALKPAMELWTLCRKPVVGTTTENVMTYGTGTINIDECRIPLNGENCPTGSAKRVFSSNEYATDKVYGNNKATPLTGRFPANLIHDGSDEVLSYFPDAKGQQGDLIGHDRIIESPNGIYGKQPPRHDAIKRSDDSKSAARFFYCAKASPSERGKFNNHETVKPLSLMKYLCRLITPKNGTIIDPYMGSGTTLLAAESEGFYAVGIDKELKSYEIAIRRCSGK